MDLLKRQKRELITVDEFKRGKKTQKSKNRLPKEERITLEDEDLDNTNNKYNLKISDSRLSSFGIKL